MPDANDQIYPQWNRQTRAPVPAAPPMSCDCQFHIYGDPKTYPPKPGALYEPPNATFSDMRGVLRAMGFARGVIVYPMPYDTDNRLLIDELTALDDKKNFRATAIIKDHVTDAELDGLNSLGVCAARINIGKYYNEERSTDSIKRSMERARELGWHVRLHIAGPHILDYADLFASMKDLIFAVDHMGHVDFREGLRSPTFLWLLDRLKNHGWWMMLSNGARLSHMEDDWDDAVPFGRTYVAAAPDRLIWGSDWPHIRWRKNRMPNDAELVELFYRYVDGDAGLIKKILVDNPARLHGFA